LETINLINKISIIIFIKNISEIDNISAFDAKSEPNFDHLSTFKLANNFIHLLQEHFQNSIVIFFYIYLIINNNSNDNSNDNSNNNSNNNN